MVSPYLNRPTRTEAEADYFKRQRKASDCFHMIQNRTSRAKLCAAGAMAGSKLRGDERKAMIARIVMVLIPR